MNRSIGNSSSMIHPCDISFIVQKLIHFENRMDVFFLWNHQIGDCFCVSLLIYVCLKQKFVLNQSVVSLATSETKARSLLIKKVYLNLS